MRISFTGDLEGDRVSYSIGELRAESGWFGTAASSQDEWKAKALHALIRRAKEYDADAIIGVDYEIEKVDAGDTPGSAKIQRVSAKGIAVKLAAA